MPRKKSNNGKRSNSKKGEIDSTKVYKIKKKKPNTKRKKIIKGILISILLIALIVGGIVFGIIFGIVKDAKIEVADMAIKFENSVVKDIDGNTIAILSGDENREYISISEMAEYLPIAFVSIEDERFYEHSGVDVKRTIGATAKYALSKVGIGSSNYGGSTITQQVIKNITEEKDRTWQRKVKEIARAYYIEQELSKDQILELYLNLIFMGGHTNIYGVEVAANYYFSKSASELDLAECAFLAGINNTPNSYNPFQENNEAVLERIKTRTKIVLDKMNELGKIKTQEEYNAAIAKVEAGLPFVRGTIVENIYSYHTDAAIMQIINQLMEEKDLTYDAAKLYLYGGGFTIYTTQNTAIQNVVNEEAKKEKYQDVKDGQNAQAAMAIIDHETGYVMAIMGGLGEKTTSLGYNRATQAKKQTGSSMKPLAVLAPGIDKGLMTAGTVYDDVPYLTFKNYGYQYRGLITLRYAIESSQNIPMVKGMQTVGTQNSIEFLKQVGINNLVEADNNLGLALGGLTEGTNTLRMAAAYAAIANDGEYIEPTFYTKVVDSEGNTVLEPKQESRQVMSSAAAYIVKEVLTQPVKTGTASNCAISGMSVAAKSGTTNDDYDRWMCGFTPYYSIAVWYGYDENRTVSGWSLNPSGQMFSSVMKQIHQGLAGKKFSDTKPDGVVSATICKDSGLLVTEECKADERGSRAYTEYFVRGTAPTKQCTCHVKVDICKDTGLLATEFCPNRETKIFITRPDYETNKAWEAADDAKYMLTIKDTCTTHVQSQDATKPTITLNGNENMVIYVNDTFVDPGVIATDDKDGDLKDKVVITGKVDTKTAGTYKITYTVQDSSGNTSTVIRTVTVKSRSEEGTPTINISGEQQITLEVGETFVEPKVTAKDAVDGDITNKIQKSGSVDTNAVGTYTITYTVKNTSGKTATKTITVNVIPKQSDNTIS